MNKLLKSMALSQVNAASSSVHAVNQVDEMGCVDAADPTPPTHVCLT